jgi:hypothetical protein
MWGVCFQILGKKFSAKRETCHMHALKKFLFTGPNKPLKNLPEKLKLKYEKILMGIS